MKRLSLSAIAVAVASVGCSTASKDIMPAQVSPMQYSHYDCDQIAAEQLRIHGRITQLGGRLDQAASNDNTIGWVGGILFWPALFWLGGTKEQEAEYARLKGEYDALHQAAIQKKCAAAMAPQQRAVTPPVPAPVGGATPEVAVPAPALTPTAAPKPAEGSAVIK